MKILLNVTSVLTMLATAFVTLSAVVFCMGMGANAKPGEIRVLKLWMLGLSLLGMAGIGTGIHLLRHGQPGWSIAASGSPSVIMVIILIIAVST